MSFLSQLKIHINLVSILCSSFLSLCINVPCYSHLEQIILLFSGPFPLQENPTSVSSQTYILGRVAHYWRPSFHYFLKKNTKSAPGRRTDTIYSLTPAYTTSVRRPRKSNIKGRIICPVTWSKSSKGMSTSSQAHILSGHSSSSCHGEHEVHCDKKQTAENFYSNGPVTLTVLCKCLNICWPCLCFPKAEQNNKKRNPHKIKQPTLSWW